MNLSISTNPIPDSWIEKLFERMVGLYGNKFLDMWGKTDLLQVKAIWAQELGKLTREEIAKGANSLINQEWCPTLPQFIKLCRPAIDFTAAYYEALNGVLAREKGDKGEWSHSAIFWASTKIGAFDFKNQNYMTIKSRWEKALQDELAKGTWKDIPEAMIALPAPIMQATRDIADKFLAETNIIKDQESKTDHKAWAKRILQRQKDGDKTLLQIQINMARQAMNNALH